MSSWGNYDNAANTPVWSVSAANLTPNTDNVAVLFDNTTVDAFKTTLGDGSVRHANQAVGVFAVDSQEAGATGHTHSGWVLRTEFTGGRAGRIQEEVLVAMNNILPPDSDGQVFANVSITLTSPSNDSIIAGSGNTAVFTVKPTIKGNTSATLSYQWQVNNNSGSLGWTNVINGTPANTTYAGGTTNTLTVTPTTTEANNYVYHVIVTATDQGVVSTSANGSLTVA